MPRIQGDVCRLPLSSRSVDGVYAAYVVQNVPSWRDALAEIGRILKPDGMALIAFGGPPADEVSSQLARHYFRILDEIGAERVGVAESTGLRSLADVLAMTAGAGLSLTGAHYIEGQQTRSICDLVQQRAGNPFASRASREAIAGAVAQALAWAAGQFGDVDQPRVIRVRHTLHHFRPAATSPVMRYDAGG